jgi:hypothetical protein
VRLIFGDFKNVFGKEKMRQRQILVMTLKNILDRKGSSISSS